MPQPNSFSDADFNPPESFRNGALPEPAFSSGQPPHNSNPPPRRSLLKSLARYAAVWLAVLLALRFIIPSYDVLGSSMEPTYPVKGERVLTDQIFFKLAGGPNRGDVIVVSSEGLRTGTDPLIKRVVGLPGERMEIWGGVVYINGQPLTESYVQNKAQYNYPATVLASDCYFVLGDNRPVSLDSHYFGCVSKDKIKARVIFNYPWHL